MLREGAQIQALEVQNADDAEKEGMLNGEASNSTRTIAKLATAASSDLRVRMGFILFCMVTANWVSSGDFTRMNT